MEQYVTGSVGLRWLFERPAWHRRAACAGTDPNDWILAKGTGMVQAKRLRAICAGCPVSGLCLKEALAEEAGHRAVGPVRLGLTSKDWRAVRKAVAALNPTTDQDYADLAAWLLDDRADALGLAS